MSIPHTCEACGHEMEIPERYAGKELLCTACKGRFTAPVAGPQAVPQPVTPAPPAAPPATTCPRCDAELPGDAAFCPNCGATAGVVDGSALLRRPVAVTLLAVVNGVGACLFGSIALLLLILGNAANPVLAAVMGTICGLIAILQAACAVGLWKLRPWGRVVQIVLACIGLPLLPLGTLVSALALWYMLTRRTRVLFSGKRVEELSPAEVAQLGRTTGGTPVAVLVAAAVPALLVVMAIVGIIAAIAIPNFLNAIQRGRAARTMAEMRVIATAIEEYRVDRNHYPGGVRSVEELVPCVQPTYLKAVPRADGWDRPFQVEITKDGDGYRITSYGRDGKPDATPAGGMTTDFDADIVYQNGQFTQWPEGMNPSSPDAGP